MAGIALAFAGSALDNRHATRWQLQLHLRGLLNKFVDRISLDQNPLRYIIATFNISSTSYSYTLYESRIYTIHF